MSLDDKRIDILAIGAHPDDVELACAGTLLQHAAAGYSFGLLDLTRGELGTRGSADLRDEEAAASAQIMGARFRKNLQFADGGFDNDEQHRLRIIEILRWCRPRVVLANALSDRHPDHGRAAKLIADACFYSGLRKIVTHFQGEPQTAFRPKQLLHYVQDYHRKPDFVVDISAVFEQKVACIRCFSSQFHDPNRNEPQTPLSGADFFQFLEARARDFARPAGYGLAEGFEWSRLAGVQDIMKLD